MALLEQRQHSVDVYQLVDPKLVSPSLPKKRNSFINLPTLMAAIAELDNMGPDYNGFLFDQESPYKTTSTPPANSRPLRERLLWRRDTNPDYGSNEAEKRRVQSTDLIRGTLLDRYQRHGLDILTQVRLIHRAHMRGNEHFLLNPEQAETAVMSDLFAADRIAGVIRSPEKMRDNNGLSGWLVRCTSFQNTPGFMSKLALQAEKLFPQGRVNTVVDDESIYLFTSAFQHLIALIHPFYEANARTSEDAMYVLWKRRPDLAHTIRYISADGTRNGNAVERRTKIINSGAFNASLAVAIDLGVQDPLQPAIITKYDDLLDIMIKQGLSADDFLKQYLMFYDRHITGLIDNFTDIDFLRSDPVMTALAQQLRKASKEYHFSGTFLN